MENQIKSDFIQLIIQTEPSLQSLLKRTKYYDSIDDWLKEMFLYVYQCIEKNDTESLKKANSILSPLIENMKTAYSMMNKNAEKLDQTQE